MPENAEHDPCGDMERLLGQVCAGSQDAARELVDKYGEVLLRAIRRRLATRLRTQYDSEDFAQAVWASFFAAPLHQYRFDTPADLTAFLVTLATNKVCSAARHDLQAKKRDLNRVHSLDGSAAAVVNYLTGHDPTPSQVVLAQEQWDRLLRGQPPQDQCILHLLRRGFTAEQIAGELRLNEKTVRRVVDRALSRIQPEGEP